MEAGRVVASVECDSRLKPRLPRVVAHPLRTFIQDALRSYRVSRPDYSLQIGKQGETREQAKRTWIGCVCLLRRFGSLAPFPVAKVEFQWDWDAVYFL